MLYEEFLCFERCTWAGHISCWNRFNWTSNFHSWRNYGRRKFKMSSDKHHNTSRVSSKVITEFNGGCIGCSVFWLRPVFCTWVSVLLHSPTDKRDSLITDCAGRQLCPSRTLGIPAYPQEKQKVCGNWQLLCYTQPFICKAYFWCIYVNLQIHNVCNIPKYPLGKVCLHSHQQWELAEHQVHHN